MSMVSLDVPLHVHFQRYSQGILHAVAKDQTTHPNLQGGARGLVKSTVAEFLLYPIML